MNDDYLNQDFEYMLDGWRAMQQEVIRLREENETLRRDVKTAIMGDSAELQDVKRENEKLRAAFRVNMLRAFSNMSHEEIDAEIAAAIRESGDE
jgi:cell shape-determining protein MreC